MKKFVILTLAILLSFRAITFAQNVIHGEPVVYSSLKAKKYKIKIATNEVLLANSLDSLKGKILYVSNKNESIPISTDLITKLSVAKPKKQTFKGMGLGMLSGLPTGFLIGYNTYGDPPGPNSYFGPEISAVTGAAWGCLGGLVIGTIIGACSWQYKEYNLSKIPFGERQTLISDILTGK